MAQPRFYWAGQHDPVAALDDASGVATWSITLPNGSEYRTSVTFASFSIAFSVNALIGKTYDQGAADAGLAFANQLDELARKIKR